MSRKFHRKSRNGCLECKKRHVKCDETLPACVACQTTDRSCSYLSLSSGQSITSHKSSPVETGSIDSNTHVSDTTTQQSPSIGYNAAAEQYLVNIEHVQLFCHFFTQTMTDFQIAESPSSFKISLDVIHRYNSSAPYLVHEILAVAALHRSFLYPAQQNYYRQCSAGFQNQALTMFNNNVTTVDESNCVPAILFSSMIGIQTLCDTLRYRDDQDNSDDQFDSFLQRFCNFCRLHQGVRIVASMAWRMLHQTELNGQVAAAQRIADKATMKGQECEGLREMLRQGKDISTSSLETYNSVIDRLQWSFDLDRSASNVSESRQMLFAWTVLLPLTYIELLEQRRPEALLILAHYGVLLHRQRSLWVIGDGGQLLIHSINRLIGAYWRPWLAWPSSEVT